GCLPIQESVVGPIYRERKRGLLGKDGELRIAKDAGRSRREFPVRTNQGNNRRLTDIESYEKEFLFRMCGQGVGVCSSSFWISFTLNHSSRYSGKRFHDRSERDGAELTRRNHASMDARSKCHRLYDSPKKPRLDFLGCAGG